MTNKKPLYLYYQGAYGHQTRKTDNLPRWAPTYKVTWPFYCMTFHDHVTNWNYYISNTTVPIVTKLGRMVNYFNQLLPLKLLNHLVTWSCYIMWKTKTIIFSLLQCLWTPNLVGWWLTLRDCYHYSHLTI